MEKKKMIGTNKYSAFFGAFKASQDNGNPLTRAEQISAFTEGRTNDIKQLTDWELQELTRQLNQVAAYKPSTDDEEKRDKMRKAIISAFYQMKLSVKDAKDWAEKQGVNGIKRAFNDYTGGELYVLIQVADKMVADYRHAIRRKLSKSI